VESAKKWKPSTRSDVYRHPEAAADGGFQLIDKVIAAKYRQAGKEIIKSVGRQLLSGQFNLTNVSFPIKCMQHKSILQIVASVATVNPIHFNVAAVQTDPVERMKHVITGTIAFVVPTHHFDKPVSKFQMMVEYS